MSGANTVIIETNEGSVDFAVAVKIVEALESVQGALKGYAQQEVPVKTGALKKSIGTDVIGDRRVLQLHSGGKGARHAHLVEYGTVHSRANPFMSRAAERAIPDVQQALKARLSQPL